VRSTDLLHNSRDGLRSRYWQAPYRGDAATRYLITALEPKLLDFGHRHQIGHLSEIERSINQPTAKAWIYEDSKMDPDNEIHPEVRRWRENEACAPNTTMWRWWKPCLSEIEVKGAFLLPSGLQFVSDNKWCRSCEISRFGWT
jgi:hypothetical protein